jgi:cyanophycinase
MLGMSGTTGPLALVGGGEFLPGNEPNDLVLVDAATRGDRTGPAFIVASAAAQQNPEMAAAMARSWFAGLGLDVDELPLRSHDEANDPAIVERARSGRFFYLTGGDPGLVMSILEGSAAWSAIIEAWQAGAALAGSSAGALAFGELTLSKQVEPAQMLTNSRRGFGLVPGVVAVPHLENDGGAALPIVRPVVTGFGGKLLGLEERTAAVWSNGEWRALGAGRVVVFDLRGERAYANGALIEGLPPPTRGR